MRTRRNDRRESRNYILGGVFIALVLIIIGIIAVQKSEKTEMNKIVDSKTYCKIKPDYITAIIIDDTDPLKFDADRNAIKNMILKEAENSPRYSKFQIFKLSNFNKPDTEVSICNPLGHEKAHFLKENKKELEIKQNLFIKTIEGAIKNTLNFEEKQTSPIMEMIKFVSIEAFGPYYDAEKHLIIVSDLMQNSASFSIFKNGKGLSFEDFKRMPFWREIKARDLRDAYVQVFLLSSSSYLQDDNLKDFWKEYFEANKVASLDIDD